MKQSGITLVELLIAMAISLGILGASYACLRSGFQSRKVVESRSDLNRRARAVLQIIARDLKLAVPLGPDAPFVGLSRSIDDPEAGSIEADNIDFGTLNHSPTVPGEGDFCEVSYFFDRSSNSTGSTGGFSLYRRKDTSPDDKRLEGGSREELCEGLQAFHLEYYDGSFWEDEWGDDPERGSPGTSSRAPRSSGAQDQGGLSSTSTDPLPLAVRITLVFPHPLSDSLAPSDGVPQSSSEGRNTRDRGERAGDGFEDDEGAFGEFSNDGLDPFADPPTDRDPSADADSTQASESDPQKLRPMVFSKVVYLELARHINDSSNSGAGMTPSSAVTPATPTVPGRSP